MQSRSTEVLPRVTTNGPRLAVETFSRPSFQFTSESIVHKRANRGTVDALAADALTQSGHRTGAGSPRQGGSDALSEPFPFADAGAAVAGRLRDNAGTRRRSSARRAHCRVVHGKCAERTAVHRAGAAEVRLTGSRHHPPRAGDTRGDGRRQLYEAALRLPRHLSLPGKRDERGTALTRTEAEFG